MIDKSSWLQSIFREFQMSKSILENEESFESTESHRMNPFPIPNNSKQVKLPPMQEIPKTRVIMPTPYETKMIELSKKVSNFS